MERPRNIIMAAAILVVSLFLVYGTAVLDRQNDRPAEAFFNQGDKYFVVSGTSTIITKSGAQGSLLVLGPLPRDSNGQILVTGIGGTVNGKDDRLVFYEKSGATAFTTLTAPFCGGTTSYVTAANNSLAASGCSYFVIDDGAGRAAWGEFREKIGTVGTQFSVLSACSNFAVGATNGPPNGFQDLSGVTFPAGSRVYAMSPIGAIGMVAGGVSNYQVESPEGIICATNGSPLLGVFSPSGAPSGDTNFWLSGRYK